MKPSLVCLGEPMLELNQQPDTGGRALYLEGCGGDTSNAAVAAARQGVTVGYLTALGTDMAASRLRALWRAEGVDAGGVRTDPTRPTAVYLVSHDEAGHAFSYFRAGSAASAYGPADVDEARVRGARVLHVSGISQGISASAADAVFYAIGLAREAGVRVSYDTNYRPRLWPAARAAATIHAAMAQTEIALPGLDDAAALTGLSDADAIADFYLRLGPGIVALKLGAAGVLLATPHARTRIPPHPRRVVDATGAGDTFAGSFLARLILGDPPEAAVCYASVAAALKCEGFGAVTPIPRAAAVVAALAHTAA